MPIKTTPLARQYRPAEVEPEILARWGDARAYHADPADTTERGRTPYAIVIPPPNVTAALHLGHALNNTLQDILTRYHRMRGDNTLWMPGTDHAGIATQTVVEKRVQQEEGKRRTDFTRDQFVEKIQAWKDEYEQRITDQLKTMGCSCDYERQRFTMDPVCAAAVREAFFQLFKDGLIYRGKRLVNWDPVTQTALADDEVEMHEIDGNFWYMKYPLYDPQAKSEIRNPKSEIEYVTVATTRPETMLGDTAVAVNPSDPERAHLIGQHVRLPIVNRVIPIIGDEHVTPPDPEGDERARYSSGYLKVTPAHDPNDYEIGERHGLEKINVMAPDASISLEHGWPESDAAQADAFLNDTLVGLSREEARKRIVQWFKDHDLLEEVRPYRHAVGHSYRSHVPIEPYLSDQWYVKVTDDRLAGAALRAMAPDQRSETDALTFSGRSQIAAPTDWEGNLRFTPARYAKTFQHWHENIRDWCISRQLWWGHRIPVWTKPGPSPIKPANFRDIDYSFDSFIEEYGQHGLKEHLEGKLAFQLQGHGDGTSTVFVCVKPGYPDIDALLESIGFVRDPDVLDTWFSSALWPLSTMGWPNPGVFPDEIPEGDALLEVWNPTDTLCTAREIITLWVSRMVMFNVYFRGRLPFRDVFVHAMIQDGAGQKMSKSLGNGVDPSDIIHSHGADAMRFTLASMTTHTQDVRLPVDMICPHTGETFEPETITTPQGYKVAAPIQACPSDPAKKMVSSYGEASGHATPSETIPLARNTSSKFDLGRNFANKLWNAVRFALTNLETDAKPADGGDEPPSAGSLPDRWILSRLARTVRQVDSALDREQYEFNVYVQALYDFFWRDLCDWYIEAVKPTVREDATQRAVLAACLDASLRLLHPAMPFVTEKLWAHLNETLAQRGVAGVTLPASELLIVADWPWVDETLIDEGAEREFEIVQHVVTATRQVRTEHTVSPKRTLDLSIKAPAELIETVDAQRGTIDVLANVKTQAVGTHVTRPGDAAAAVAGEIELYLHGLIDTETERKRLAKRAEELDGQIANLQKRLSNESYVNKAPAHLVQESRDQLAAAERERRSVQQQLDALA